MSTKTLMERVIADERRQRVREGVSLTASKCSENHSGVAPLRYADRS